MVRVREQGGARCNCAFWTLQGHCSSNSQQRWLPAEDLSELKSVPARMGPYIERFHPGDLLRNGESLCFRDVALGGCLCSHG